MALERSRRPHSIGLQIDNLAFTRRDGPGANVIGLGGQLIHEIVVMRRIMVK
jgi:hypothetical protein